MVTTGDLLRTAGTDLTYERVCQVETLTQIYRRDTSRMPCGAPSPSTRIQVSPRLTAILNAGFVRFRPVRTPSTAPTPVPGSSMSQRKPATRAEAKQAQATRRPSTRSGGSGGSGGHGSRGVPGGRSRGRKWLLRALWAVLALGVLGLVAVGIAYARTDIPDANELATAQASIVYYSDGKTELARLSDAEGNRESVPLSKVPDHMQKAMLAAEDQDFYQNNGISPTGIARAVLGRGQGWPGDPGRVDDHPAVRQELLPHRRPHAVAQGPRDPHLAQDRPAAVQGPDPRELPQHDLLRPRRVRHPDRVEGVLQQGRLEADPRRERLPRLGHPRSVLLRPGAGRRAGGQRQGALGLHPRRDGREGLADPGGARRRHLPGVPRSTSRAPRAAPTATSPRWSRTRSSTSTRSPQSDIDRGGLPHRLDRRQEQAVRHGQGGAGRAAREDPVGARRHGLDQARQRCHRRAVRRRGLQKRQQNAATQDKMQAGSTFKIFTLIAALQSGDFSLKSRLSGASPQYFEEFADPSASTVARPPRPGEELRQRVASATSTCARRPAARSTPSTRR